MVTRIEREEIAALPDTLTNESFLVVFGSIPGSSDTKPLTLLCNKCSFPRESLGRIETRIAGFIKRQAGMQENDGTWTLTFVETIDMAVLSRLRTWKEQCRGKRSGVSVGYSEDYSTSVEVTIFDSTGAKADSGKYYKVFPIEIPEVNFDSTQTGQAIEVAVQFSYDYFVPEKGTTL
jgi:hypothetical protein